MYAGMGLRLNPRSVVVDFAVGDKYRMPDGNIIEITDIKGSDATVTVNGKSENRYGFDLTKELKKAEKVDGAQKQHGVLDADGHIELNAVTAKDSATKEYMREIATKKYGMSAKALNALYNDILDVVEKVNDLKEPRKAADAYLAWCKEKGYTPKFAQFAGHKNYYKLLEDFRGYDNEGKPVIQGAVRLKLPTAWQGILDEALGDTSQKSGAISAIGNNQKLMDDARKRLKHKNLDGDIREAVGKLRGALGAENVTLLRQKNFLDVLESEYQKEMSADDARRKVEVFRNGEGYIYGFAVGSRIVLNENLFNANTPAHEFAHIWAKVIRNVDPKLWKKGVSLLKQSPVWQEVVDDGLYENIRDNEEAIA